MSRSILALPAALAFAVYSEKDVTVQHGGVNDTVMVVQRLPSRHGFGAITPGRSTRQTSRRSP
ncbi:MAG: hypothetical protein HY660_06525 [Armatimonadetes bacterium]|nr:hypothetical protein [Armatimonadota bacterium]